MSKRRRHKGGHEEEHPDERWLVSYADMITVLMILFIMLYAVSSVNISKYHALQRSTAKALGHDPNADTPPIGPKPNPQQKPVADPTKKTSDNEDPVDKIVQQLKAQVKAKKLSGVVEISRENRGIIIRFSDRVLFAPGSATLTPTGRTVLEALSPVLRTEQYPLVVEGHTDNKPIRTPLFPSNWELSTYRSTSVLHYLVGLHVSGNKLSAAGYADTHPRASNATDRGRAANRRVEIVVQAPVVEKSDTQEAAVEKAAQSKSTPAAAPKAGSGH